jgi:predicted RNA-binding protein with PIN domain
MSDAFTRHLLVDGSNIMHAWPELRALLSRDRNAARSRLSHAVAPLHDAGHLRVTIVFDGSGPELTVERQSGHPTFAHVHTPAGTTADEVIIQLVGRAGKPGDCVVATDDRAVRQAVEGLGASCVSSDDLAAWAERADSRQDSRLRKHRAENDRHWKRR